MAELAIQRVMDAYKHNRADIGRDLKVHRATVHRWVTAGLVPAHLILPLVKFAKKRDALNERKQLPPEDVLIRQLLKDHERSFKRTLNNDSED